MVEPASSTTAKIYIQAQEQTAISMALHAPKVWEQYADDIYSILKRAHLENFFHHINNIHQNINFVLVYRKLMHTGQYLPYSSHHQMSCKESVVSSLFNRANSIIANKDDITKTALE